MPIETILALVAITISMFVVFANDARRRTQEMRNYPRRVDAHTQEVSPGCYVLSVRAIDPEAYVPPGMRAVAWCNGQPVRFEPITEGTD